MDTEKDMMISETQKVNSPDKQVAKQSGWGLRFKSAREALNLTPQEAASRLYLNLKIITTIENEDSVHGTPAIFMRGYVRSYGRLLNIPEKEIDQAITELGLMTPQSNITENLALQTRPKVLENSHRYVRWITYPVIAILITLVVIWWNNHNHYFSDIDNTKIVAQPTPAPSATSNQAMASTAKPSPQTPETSSPAAQPTPPQANIVTAERKNQATPPHPRVANMDMDIPEPGLETD